jgi:hypothetical protein
MCKGIKCNTLRHVYQAQHDTSTKRNTLRNKLTKRNTLRNKSTKRNTLRNKLTKRHTLRNKLTKRARRNQFASA